MRTKYKLLEDYEGGYAKFKAGEIIYEFDGHDYGCVRDDMAYGGIESKAMIADPSADSPFFTVPVQLIEKVIE